VTSVPDQYRVTIVKYGTRDATRADVYLNYPLYQEPDGPIGMDYFFWLVQNDERTIVVDTGFSRRGGENRQRTSLYPVAQLMSDFGVDPNTSPDVIVTHAHYDHIGNLDLFPTSRIVIAAAELDFWSGPHAHRVMFHHSVEDEELETLRDAHKEERVTTFRDRFDVAPGVQVIEVGGHTPGQSMVTVNTAEGVVLLASDAIHYYEEYDRDMLFMSVSSLVDMYATFDRVRALVESGEIDIVVSGHDPETLSRYTAVEGTYRDVAAVIGGARG
jgi:glyoxylase-like metal-dependent hydrolase (beta-lactamase superfamily II)